MFSGRDYMDVLHLAKRGKSTLDGLSREACRVIWGCWGVVPGEEMFYKFACFAFVKKALDLFFVAQCVLLLGMQLLFAHLA
jgi:hypothetical protein